MAYIESHQELRDHPKMRRAARLLGVSEPTMIGHLHLLWWWALTHVEDGDVTEIDPIDLADAARWEGDPEVFVNALRTCGTSKKPGFIEKTEDGRLVLHDWWDYAGRLIEQREKRRADTRRRVREWRERQRTAGQDAPERNAVVTRNGGVTGNADVTPGNAPTVPYPTVSINNLSSDMDDESEPEPAAEAGTRRRRVVYEHDSEPYQLAVRLSEHIRANNPHAKRHSEAMLQRWANTARLMIERDGHSAEDIGRVMDWCQADPFWLANILSMDALRRHFDRLTLQMRQPRAGAAPREGAREPQPVARYWRKPAQEGTA